MAQLETILRQLFDATTCFERMLSKANGNLATLDPSDLLELHTTLAAAAESFAPPGSVYRRNVDSALSWEHMHHQAPMLAGVVRSLYAAYLSGFMGNFAQLVRADLFGDFLEMAEHLIEQDYKDAAAVLIGGVLEEHLRKLCQGLGIDVSVGEKPKPAGRMNEDLVARGGYGKLDAKNITAWLGLRNSAAHAKYNEYSLEQVKLMLLGVRELAAKDHFSWCICRLACAGARRRCETAGAAAPRERWAAEEIPDAEQSARGAVLDGSATGTAGLPGWRDHVVRDA